MSADSRDPRGSCALRPMIAMQELQGGITPGAVVQARGERWHVREARRSPGCALITLEGADATNFRRLTTLLLPFDRIEVADDTHPIRCRRSSVLRSTLRATRAERPAGSLWCATSARMEVWPWQLAPALAVLGGATRLLLADAVGLGKTVQAGLVLAELGARGLVERALVVAPAAVRDVWAAELGARFALSAEVLDVPALLALERSGPAGANPWSRAAIVVASIDLIKRPEVCAAVEGEPLDLLIVDEAHHATPGTDRQAVVRRLARQVPWVLLVSATPHSGDSTAYGELLAVGEVGTPPAEPMQLFRRSHDDVRFIVPRRTHVLRVVPSTAERGLHAGVLAYARDVCRSRAAGTSRVPLLAALLARRATSSAWAALRTLQRRLARLDGAAVVPDSTAPGLPWEEDEDPDAAEQWPATPLVGDCATERARLWDLIARAEAALAADSKAGRLRRLLRRLCEPVIVFTEFRDTLEWYRPMLEAVTTVTCLHGGLGRSERQRRVSAFLEGRVRVLLTTDVAAEGLNLQIPARLVLTVEWPWNPLRLEQRIGRVHRLGQTRVVHAIHLTARDSYEETVVARVLGRAARATADLADHRDAAEDQIAAAILDLQAPPPAVVPADAKASIRSADHRARQEAARVARLRAPVPDGAGAPMRATWAPPRRGRGTTRVVVVCDVTSHAASGWLSASHVVPVVVTLTETPPHRRAWRLVCQRLARDVRVRQAAIAARVGHGCDSWAAVRARLHAIRAARDAARRREVQPSLFDRRAIQEASSRDAVSARWSEWQTRLLARLAPAEPGNRTVRVLAILPMSDGPE